ncbi:phosphopantetheine-binding protein, partial [Streptomyces sp. S.PNR 29]|uniref:phosphopantetheine-binding protein n=1 Tax=Streptomyces sp. S.PNR 29 TaxID=2973805 RepID=UPI0025B0035B
NTRTYVLDAGLQPVPTGVTGELYIAGHGLARGYLGRPDLTAERFTADPYGPPGTRMYRTGDLAHWTTDGNLHFDGRADQQVKIRGFRIEPAEIETALLQHPHITQAAVIARQDRPGDKRLTAYLTTTHPTTDDTLRSHLATHLPDYMIPAAFLTLDALPLTPNGKLDHKALPAPHPTTHPQTDHTPRTPQEETLCRLFAEVIGLPRPAGTHDNFFTLGGDSITSIQLVSRARKAGITLTPRDVFQHQTPAQLATTLTYTDTTHTPTTPDDPTGTTPITPIIGWLRELDGPIDQFNQSVLLKTPTNLTEHHLTTALQTLLDHHHTLRSTLHRHPDTWTIHTPPPGTHHATHHLTRIPVHPTPNGQLPLEPTHIRNNIKQLAPETGHMLHATWFDPGPHTPGRLLITIHHLVIDGVSWRILLPDLITAIQTAHTTPTTTPTLTPTTTSYRHWANTLHHHANTPQREA